MRSASFQWWCFSTLVLVLVGGCQELGLPTGLNGSSQVSPIPGTQTDVAAADTEAELAAQAQAHAQRVAGAGELPGRSEPPREILWRDVGGSGAGNVQADTAPAQSVAAGAPFNGLADPHGVALTPMGVQAGVSQSEPSQAVLIAPVSADTAAWAPHVEADVPDGPSQAQAYAQLLQTVRHGDDSNLSKAITAASLAAIGTHGELDWTMLAPLSPVDQERVQGYYRAVTTLRAELLDGGGEVNREAVAGRLDEMFGSQPVSIRTIELCEKVMGYGVYDAFPDHTFVAGREQKVIVYVELENFKPAKRDGGDGYEVRLRQELELYESNGFEVWSHEPVKITDVSHNKRRDFFVVQLVTLPAQLRMGQYHLKVRVYDENAGTRDEGSVTITLVADDTLVKRADR